MFIQSKAPSCSKVFVEKELNFFPNDTHLEVNKFTDPVNVPLLESLIRFAPITNQLETLPTELHNSWQELYLAIASMHSGKTSVSSSNISDFTHNKVTVSYNNTKQKYNM